MQVSHIVAAIGVALTIAGFVYIYLQAARQATWTLHPANPSFINRFKLRH